VSDVIDTTAEEIGSELVPAPAPSANLFRTDDPVDVLERATRVAQALKGVIDKQGLVSKIQGREHVRVEGWTTLGSMLGVVPVVEWTRKTDDGDGWEARVVAQTLDGRTIGAAEAMCTKKEGKPWNSRPDYALRSMAQTRATSKALRGPLGFVVTLAGYEATPAEEMPSGDAHVGESAPDVATVPQKKFLRSLITKNGLNVDVMSALLKGVGFSLTEGEKVNDAINRLTRGQCSSLIEEIQNGAIKTGESDVPADGSEFVHEAAGDTPIEIHG
jgi:hypothetical protein